MALLKYPKYVRETDGGAYDTFYLPGAGAPFAGIYRCEGCGREVARAQAHPLPMPHHHEHTPVEGNILWRLIVYAYPDPQG